MRKSVIRFVIVALPLFAVPSIDPPPAHACNIANPPPPCANVPGSNPVAGLGTLHQNQFQSVPGAASRTSFRLSPNPLDGSFAPTRRNTYKRPSYGPDSTGGDAPITGRQPIPATDPSEVRPVTPGEDPEQSREIKAEMEDIVRDYYSDNGGAPTSDPVLNFQLVRLLYQEVSADEFSQRRREAGREEPVAPVNPRQGLLTIDNQSIDAENDSVLDDIESFFVAM